VRMMKKNKMKETTEGIKKGRRERTTGYEGR
jgi:hypothetical protein